jgi:hypothetical protein
MIDGNVRNGWSSEWSGVECESFVPGRTKVALVGPSAWPLRCFVIVPNPSFHLQSSLPYPMHRQSDPFNDDDDAHVAGAIRRFPADDDDDEDDDRASGSAAAAAAEPDASREDRHPDEAGEVDTEGYFVEEEEEDDDEADIMTFRERDLLDFVRATYEREFVAELGEHEHLDVDDKVRIAAYLAGSERSRRQPTHPRGSPAEQAHERKLLAHLLDLGGDDLRNSFRTYLCLVVMLGPNPPVRQVARSGAVPVFVEIFRTEMNPQRRLLAAGVLAVIGADASSSSSSALTTTMTTPEHARLMDDLNLLPCLVGALRSGGRDSVALLPLLSVLVRVPGDSPTYGPWALDTGALPELLDRLSAGENHLLAKVRALAGALRVFLCREGGVASSGRVAAALRALRVFLGDSDAAVLSDACRVLGVLTLGAGRGGDDGGHSNADERIEMVVKTPGVCRRLAGLLIHPSPYVKSYVGTSSGTLELQNNPIRRVRFNSRPLSSSVTGRPCSRCGTSCSAVTRTCTRCWTMTRCCFPTWRQAWSPAAERTFGRRPARFSPTSRLWVTLVRCGRSLTASTSSPPSSIGSSAMTASMYGAMPPGRSATSHCTALLPNYDPWFDAGASDRCAPRSIRTPPRSSPRPLKPSKPFCAPTWSWGDPMVLPTGASRLSTRHGRPGERPGFKPCVSTKNPTFANDPTAFWARSSLVTARRLPFHPLSGQMGKRTMRVGVLTFATSMQRECDLVGDSPGPKKEVVLGRPWVRLGATAHRTARVDRKS